MAWSVVTVTFGIEVSTRQKKADFGLVASPGRALRSLVLIANAERLVWLRAAQIYGPELSRFLDAAIGTFKRAPGLTRLYGQSIGEPGLEALLVSLNRGRNIWFYPLHEGVEIRPELRWHLFYALRRKLILDEYLTDAMVDDHISADLGL